MHEENEKGFTIRDRRTTLGASQEETEAQKEPPKPEVPPTGEAQASESVPLPEATFASLIISLAMSVDLHLGNLPDPQTQQVAKNLPIAKQTIDLLVILQEKTRGNLTAEEERLLNSLLYDLRMKYVQEANPSQ